jgi:hypothetical protein
MKPTSDFHCCIGQTIFGVAESILDNPTTFHAGNGVLDTNPNSGQLAIGAFLSGG